MPQRLFRCLLFAAILSLTGCGTEYYEFRIDPVESTEVLPQEGTLLQIPFSYVLVPTRFQPGIEAQPFRYQARADGEVYSYVVFTDGAGVAMSGGSSGFMVVVPANDGYAPRAVTVEISRAQGYSSKKWGEWETVYSGTQAALAAGEPRSYADLDSRLVRMRIQDRWVDLELADNASVQILKRLLSQGDLTFKMGVANNLTSTLKGEETALLHTTIPLNHTEYQAIHQGQLWLEDWGGILIYNETRKKGIDGRDTYLGTIVQKDLPILDDFCCNARETDGATITLSLRP